MPGWSATKLYVTEPPFASAVGVSEVIAPVLSSTGAAATPSAVTPAWPGKMIDVLAASVFLRITRTLSPCLTQRLGPGYWNAPLPSAKPHM